MDQLLFWGFLLLGAAALLGVMELLIPSAGVIGIVAVAVAVAGVVCLFIADTAWGVVGTAIVLVAGPVGTWYGFKILPYTPMGRGLILSDRDPEDDEEGPPESPVAARLALVGQEGEVLTDLRPVGVVLLEGTRLDAVAETGYIPAGSRVRVVAADGLQLTVRLADSGGSRPSRA
ncbi:MAG: NfeD family protein [Planctomycetota bacterium]